MKALELKIPPALLMLVFMFSMWGVDQLLPQFIQIWPWHERVAKVIFGIAVSLIAAGAYSFSKAKTTVDPMRPEHSTSIVTTGIYGYSRNPMYLGFLLVILAFAFKLANPVCFVALPLFVLYMNRFQIKAEERALQSLFGDEYLAYGQKVRRWI